MLARLAMVAAALLMPVVPCVVLLVPIFSVPGVVPGLMYCAIAKTVATVEISFRNTCVLEVTPLHGPREAINPAAALLVVVTPVPWVLPPIAVM